MFTRDMSLSQCCDNFTGRCNTGNLLLTGYQITVANGKG